MGLHLVCCVSAIMPVSVALFVIVDIRSIIIIIVIITITTVIVTSSCSSSSPRELLMPATTGSLTLAAHALKHDFIQTPPTPTPHRVKAAPRL